MKKSTEIEWKLQFRHYRGLRWEVGARFEIPRAIAVLSRTSVTMPGGFTGYGPFEMKEVS
jgi:hypothetical protein